MEDKPKGRARGRARGNVPSSQQLPIPGAGAQAQPQSGQIQRPGGLQNVQAAALTKQFGATKIEDHSSSGNGGNGNGNGNGNGDGNGVGRGVARGRHEVPRITWTRPDSRNEKKGKAGSAIQLASNFYTLQKKQDWILCLYHVDFRCNPPEDRTATKKKMLRDQHKTLVGGQYVFDGMHLFMIKNLGKDLTTAQGIHPDTKAPYVVNITKIKELGASDAQYGQILNIIMKKCLEKMNLTLMNRGYFDPKQEKIQTVQGERLKVWPGFETCIRQYESNILLNVAVSHKFLRNNSALEEMEKRMKQEHNLDQFLGSIVMTSYNDKTYRVDDVNTKVTPLTYKFEMKDRRTNTMKIVNLVDWYKMRYNITITNVKQPIIISRPKAKDIRRGDTQEIALVPELCKMTGISDTIRNNRTAMRELAQYMKMNPDARCKALRDFNAALFKNADAQKELNQWGLSLQQKLVEVQGRVIPDEPLSQGGKTFNYQRHLADWSRDIRSLSLNKAFQLKNWTFIFPDKIKNEAQGLLQAIIKVAGPMGMQIGQPELIALQRDGVPDYTRELNKCAGKQLVMCLLFNNNAQKYSAIKKTCTVNLAVPSQCVLLRTAKAKSIMSVASKIAIQINCKLGGEVWSVGVPKKVQGALIIGYDTYHDNVQKGASYGATVASLNETWTRYYGQVSKHLNREELSQNFKIATKNALDAYIKTNKKPPEYLLVYRDGVGEGQISYVKEQEVGLIKQCIKELNIPTKLAFIIVNKRHSTRLVSLGRKEENPPPGTIVDDVVTRPEFYDFYLVSQACTEGTVSPTGFNIIEDTTDLIPDYMQRIAYKLTHLYYNWQGTVRVPAPCLYAHKLAFITGQSIHAQPHQALADKLWYL